MALNRIDKNLIDPKLLQEVESTSNKIGNLSELKTTNKTDIVKSVNEVTSQLADKAKKFNQEMDAKQLQQKIRSENVAKLSRFSLPTEFTWKNPPIDIFTDGKSYSTFFDITKFKNVGGTTYYIDSINGLNTNNGLSEGTAFLNFNKALSVALDGDTIVIVDELLSRTSMSIGSINITKNINIIAKTKTVIKGADTHTFTQTAGYTKVWETSRSNALRVVDYPKKYEFKKVNSLAECESTSGSWYTDGTKVFIHTLESTQPIDNKHFILMSTANLITIDASLRNVKVYFENIEIVGGVPSVTTKNSTTTKPSVYMKNSGVFYNCGTLQGALYMAGCNEAFFQNVEVAYSWEDGFDYHLLNGTATKFIEVNCNGHSNGIPHQANNFNGSTAHNDCKGIRFGGNYHSNIGPNLADVQGVTQSLNFEITAFDSVITEGFTFNIQISDGDMWLYNCLSFGSVSDLYCPTGGTMYVDKGTIYYTKGGNGTMIIAV